MLHRVRSDSMNWMLGFLGAYSIDNAGDALVGYATRRAVLEHVPSVEYAVLSPELPHPFWRHRWDRERGLGDAIRAIPASEDCRWATDLDALIIGGGGLVMLDPSFAPFRLGEPGRWPSRCKAAWNAVGSQNQPWYLTAHRDDYVRIQQCCERLAYTSVRSDTTLRFLRECGVQGEVQVVPDPAIGLTQLPDAIERDVDGRLAEIQLTTTRDRPRPTVGISLGATTASPGTAPFFVALEAELRELAADCDLVFFPFSSMQDDVAAQARLAERLGARIIRDVMSPLVLWGLIGRLDAYIGTRFHAIVAAYAQNVPFVAIDEYLRDATASSKVRELLVDRGLEVHYLCPYLPDASLWKIAGVVRDRARVSFAPQLAEDRRRLAAHYRDMLGRLGLLATGS